MDDFSVRIWKKGEGLLPFQRRWARFTLTVYLSRQRIDLVEDGKNRVTHTMPLMNLVMIIQPNSEKHNNLFDLRNVGMSWRLKALGAAHRRSTRPGAR